MPDQSSPSTSQARLADLAQAEAFITAVDGEAGTQHTYRNALLALLAFIRDQRYFKKTPPPYQPANFKADLLVRFYQWLSETVDGEPRFKPGTQDAHIEVITRFIGWLADQGQLDRGVAGKARERLKRQRKLTVVKHGRGTTPVTDLEHADEFLGTIGSSRRTEQTYRYSLVTFIRFIQDTHYLPGPPPYRTADLRVDVISAFYRHMVAVNQATNGQYGAYTQTTYLAALKRFLIWLDSHDHLAPDFQLGKALNMLKADRGGQRLPRGARHAEKGISRLVTYYDRLPLPDGEKRLRQRLELLRARAVVHTLWSTAARVSELTTLRRKDIGDGRREEVQVEGKGQKTRTIYLDAEARVALRAYLDARQDTSEYVFVSHGPRPGSPLGRMSLWRIVKEAVRAVNQQKPGSVPDDISPHFFRHYRAQQMLDDGMELHVLQAVLGHDDIGTTRKTYAPATDQKIVRAQLKATNKRAGDVAASADEDDAQATADAAAAATERG